ncbi:centromere protein T isoform X2 [Phaenicophaeus curvirostris]|uniref:centromere protein T isoform X2 n=1 Tax=Phaenicophaeus curvirostris TaxID=33595 RepID=UPI0037F0E960
MADGGARGRRGARPARAARENASASGNEKNSGRSAFLKQKAAVFPELDNDTPRVMLKRIILTQPQVSPVAPQLHKDEETEAAQLELPSKRVSSVLEMQLPDLVPEDTSITTFRVTKKRKKLSISEFERAVDKRLPQNQARSMLDSTALARSLRMSLGSLILPDTVEKRKGLLRRPKNHKAIDVEAFEGGVEQNMLKRKAQSCLLDSQTPLEIQAASLTSDADIVLSNTELFIQPPSDEQNQSKLSALGPQLSDSKTSAQRSKVSDAAQEEARLVGLASSVGTNEESTQTESEELILNHEHIDRMTHESLQTPVKEQEAVNRWSSSLPPRSPSKSLESPVTLKPKRSSSMSLREVVSRIIEDLDVSDTEEEMANTANKVEQIFREAAEHYANTARSGRLEKQLTEKAELQITVAQDARVKTETPPSEEEGIAEGDVEHRGSPEAEREIAKDIGAGCLVRHSDVISFSEKNGVEPLEDDVEQADVLEDQAIPLELDDLEQEPTEDGAEDPEGEEASMKTPTFVRAAAYKPLLSTPRPAKPAAPKSSLQPLQAKPVAKSSGASQRKPREPEIASSLIKGIFRHYAKMPVARDAFKVVEKCSQRYFKQLSSDLEAYSRHAGRKTVEMADLELLMRRQGLVTDKMPMNVLIEHYFPMEYRKLLIPVAVCRNKVIPSK